MNNELDDALVKFEGSDTFTRIRDDLMNQFMQSDGVASVNASVEKLITTDLESNPRLLDALVSSGVDDATSEARLAAMFERRVKSEVEAGMTGRPFEQFLAPKREDLARKVAVAARDHQKR